MEGVISRENSPTRSPGKRFAPDDTNELYKSAMNKLIFSAWRFDRETNGDILKLFESKELDKDFFRFTLKSRMDCRLSREEFEAIYPHFENNGSVNGCEFLLLFYRVRFEYKSKLLTERIKKEAAIRKDNAERIAKRQQDFENRVRLKVSPNFTEEDSVSAFEKLKEAAVRYDRLMPGAVQLDGFDCEFLPPELFKEQLKMVFNVQFTAAEFGALVRKFSKSEGGDDNIECASFLVQFFKMGFNERSSRIKAKFQENKRLRAEKELRLKLEQEELDRKNALKCSFEYTKDDEERVIKKLKEAARLYDKSTPAAVSMKSFEVAFMEPHVFKEQLKRVFNLDLSPPELGALITMFDDNGDGFISCQEFSKNFLAIGFAEREKFLKDFRESERKKEEVRKEKIARREALLAQKNALKCSFEFTEDEKTSAMQKLVEAAWRFDRSMPGAPSLDAFESKTMEAHEFKEQLRRSFFMKLSPGELGSIMSYFQANEKGQIVCIDFVNKFISMGIDERARQKIQWKKYDQEVKARKKKMGEEKLAAAERKVAVDVLSYTEEEFQSAFTKLSVAAFKYQKSGSGAIGLDAFEAESMPPHVFKEQLKLVFNCKVTNQELGALMSYFDKEETGSIVCKDFVMQFFRTGIEERDRLRQSWRDEDRRRKEKDEQEAKEREEYQIQKLMREVDYEFIEADFDSALRKLVLMAFHFDFRQLGPAGWTPFQGNCLTPVEFREIAKRTFNLTVNAQELGALVTYFDSSMKGVVSCATFLNIFVQLRLRCEKFKGKPQAEVKVCLQEYHDELKEEYKARIQNQISANEDLKLRPWRLAIKVRAKGKIAEKRPPPENAIEKLKRHLRAGRLSSRMDLSTSLFHDDSESKSAPTTAVGTVTTTATIATTAAATAPGTDDDGNDIGGGSTWALTTVAEAETEPSGPTEVQKKIKMKKEKVPVELLYLLESDMVYDPRDMLEYLRDPTKKHAVLSMHAKSVNFILYTVPNEVFKMTGLTQLWLTNNRVESVPSKIGMLENLEVLCLSGNRLTQLPEELRNLTKLQRLYVARNELSSLPPTLSTLQSIITIDFSKNKFPEFPPVLCDLAALQYVDASYNQLADLPQTFCSLRSLTFLDITGNVCASAPLKLLSKMPWVDVVGRGSAAHAPPHKSSARDISLNRSLHPSTSSPVQEPPTQRQGAPRLRDDDADLEQFIKNRASSRITAKLRRRKRAASKDSRGAVTAGSS